MVGQAVELEWIIQAGNISIEDGQVAYGILETLIDDWASVAPRSLPEEEGMQMFSLFVSNRM
jgi:hypothetical protein